MASTYSTNLRLELIGTGEQQGTWGATTNTNLGTLLEEAIGGYVSVTVSDAGDTTLTTNNGSTDQARNAVINLTGTISATRNVLCPAIEKVYIVRNATTGGFAVTFKVSGQTGVSIPNGSTYLVYVNGTDAVAVTGSIASQLSSNVAITGGTISGLSNLSVANATVAGTVRTNLGVGTGDSPQFTAIELGNASDTTISRVAAGVIAVEGANVVTTTATQTLTNKTLTDPTITGAIIEDVYTITDGAAFEIDPGNGTMQNVTLGASRTPKGTNFAAGESVTLRIKDGSAYTITWTDSTFGTGGVIWVGGTAPTLDTTNWTVVVLWKEGSQVYGKYIGVVA